MRKVMEAFLRDAGVSNVSSLSYRRDLEKLLSYFSMHPESATKEELSAYFQGQGATLSRSSLSRQVSVVRSFYAYLKEKGHTKTDPMRGLRAADFEKKDGQVLDRDEFSRLISCFVPGFRGMRDGAMLMLLCETGLRVSELVELNCEDFHADGVSCGKDRRRRVLPISPNCRDALFKYLAVRELYASEDPALFITARGKRMSRQGFWKNLKDRAIYCRIYKTISPHTLRRSLALHLMEDGKDREAISNLLGNVDPASLRNYKTGKKGESHGSF